MSVTAIDERVYLRACLAPLAPFLARADVTDLYLNRPGELWVETLGGAIERHDLPQLDDVTVMRLARQVAALNAQGISRAHPLLSASLPDGARIQVIGPPATRGAPAVAIRKHVAAGLSLDDYRCQNAFAGAILNDAAPAMAPARQRVAASLAAGDAIGALRAAVVGRMNILVSGGTSSGKTTFLDALIHVIPPEERLIFIEDTPELTIRHANALGLVAARGALGEASVGADDLVTASLRMRPDRIILGELRGGEALAFLRAINTGHPGSMTTIHADGVDGAIEQLVLLVLMNGTQLTRADIRHYIRATIGLAVHLERQHGRRRIAAVRLLGDGAAV